jgi:hypothetical protein
VTEDSVGHPPAGDHVRPALHLGLGALLLAAAWLTASFFLGTGSASAAEPPQPTPPAGLLASVSHTAAALTEGPRSAAAAPTAATATAQVPQRAPAIPFVQSAVPALSDAVTSVRRAPVETVTDVASGLVSTVAQTTNTVLPMVSSDVLGPVAGTVQEVLGDLATAAPVGHLPGTPTGILPAPSASEWAASEPCAAPAGPGVALTRHPAAGVLATSGARIRALETSLANPLRAPSVSLPAPLPAPLSSAPNGTPSSAGSDAGAGSAGAAGAHSAADLTRTRFLQPALLLATTGGARLLPPLSPSYDSDSTPD